MVTCQKLTELITDYLEGRLSFTQRLSVQWHLGTCKYCRAYLRQMKMTVLALGKMPDEPISVDVRGELLARFRKMRPRIERPIAVPKSIRLLASLEKSFGGRRGWVVAGLTLLVALVALLASGLHSGALGEASCFVLEVSAGLMPVTLVGLAAFAKQSRLSNGTFATLGIAGGLVALAMLEVSCPLRHVAQHALVFHWGGLVLAGLTGVAASRLPAFR